MSTFFYKLQTLEGMDFPNQYLEYGRLVARELMQHRGLMTRFVAVGCL
jgi:hypothetical protein